ncbi:Putative uncharacterized protein [Moritella viscosa]|uniref:Uncharacterized protein n=1 Tax=Moritella viscosa TaxID=80854 RepID=A0A1L0CG39_9GAMM|nr:Putative uncharacterized protein [Moritella viscosa]SHO23054.1 Putative uncharacterized protein [Moritella viscosa]
MSLSILMLMICYKQGEIKKQPHLNYNQHKNITKEVVQALSH